MTLVNSYPGMILQVSSNVKLTTIQLQSRRINLVNRQESGKGHNLPLGDIFKGTDLQGSYSNSYHM